MSSRATLKAALTTGSTITQAKLDDLIDSLAHVSEDGLATDAELASGLATKQATLVSGTNIKTINSASILGSGNTTIGPGYHADVASFRDRIEAAGGSIDSATLQAIDRFVATGVQDGWYAKCSEIYPFVGTNLASSLQKLKYTTQAALANVSSLFTSSNYTQQLGFGTATVISGAQLTTGFIPGNNGVTNTTAFMFCANCAIDETGDSGGLVGDVGPNAAEGSWYYRSDVSVAGVGKVADMNTPYKAVRVVGAASTVTTGVVRGYYDSVQMTAGNTAAGDWTKEVVLFRSSRYGATYGQAGRLGCVVLGGSAALTDAEVDSLTTAIRELQYGCGRINWKRSDALLVGDSITSGQGATNSVSFMMRGATRLGYTYQNVAIPSLGLTDAFFPFVAAQGQSDRWIAEYPSIVFLMLGTNDISSGVTSGNYQTALSNAVSAVVTARKKLILCSIPYNTTVSEATTRAYVEAAAAVAIANNVIFIDMDRAIRDQTTPANFMSDANHPDEDGHVVLSERLVLGARGIMKRELAINFGSINTLSTATATVEMLTVRAGQRVTVVTPSGLENGMIASGYVSANDTVTVKLFNATAGTVDPASGIFQIYVDVER